MNGCTRVAVIDDDRLVRTMLADALVDEGFEVAAFGTAEEALSALWETPVDAVVTDIFLPRMNGFDLLKELRSRQWARRTPCVAISAVTWPESQLETVGTAVGPNLLVTKPFDVPRFMASLICHSRPRKRCPPPSRGRLPFPSVHTRGRRCTPCFGFNAPMVLCPPNWRMSA